MIDTLLIANRGEIACRVIRTARRLGIRTVAVYSDADRHALHVELADTAVHIGPPEAAKSYLKIDALISAAQKTGAKAIHPGYGFLSENADFAAACEAAGIIFVGPPQKAIEAMGSKSAAKRIMEQAGVPLIPGYHGDDQSPETLKASADEMGYPVLLKATAGGGGKGMRVVNAEAEFTAAYDAAKREAKKSFGDERMLVEKYLTRPRHIEIQLFCDTHGNAVHLFERDCSLQRRHQKVIEEAPAPGLSDTLRVSMGETAIRAARAIDYVGAGTVEFLLDTDGSFYFMEMNTRLQVEHPVTEFITGEDLVEWQLRVAAGEPLPKQQSDLVLKGHAVEARLYAEDPAAGFLPRTGRIDAMLLPDTDANVRVDTGVRSGDDVSVYYDPMIAKLICYGEDRASALGRLRTALNQTRIAGLESNVVFLHRIAGHPAFMAAELDTGFIERHASDLLPADTAPPKLTCVMSALALLATPATPHDEQRGSDAHSPWADALPWRLNLPASRRFSFLVDTCEMQATADYAADGALQLSLDEAPPLPCEFRLENNQLIAVIDGQHLSATVVRKDRGLVLFDGCQGYQVQTAEAETGDPAAAGAAAGFTAPMPGTVIAIAAAPGTPVKAGETLLVMEAMKMEHSVNAPVDGTVTEYYCQQGDLVSGGAELLAFEPAARS